MIDCTGYRQAMMARPHEPDPTLAGHRESCPDCNLFTDRLLRFESRLERALGVALPAEDPAAPAAPLSDRAVPLHAKSHMAMRLPAARKSWLAMAAGVLVALAVAGGLWLGIPRPSLAADVVTHMREEPQAWRRTDVPVPDAALRSVLRDSRVRLADGPGLISYANSCRFRGHRVPHLVVQTDSGPVTVMVLVHESVPESVKFDEQGYRGVIVPVTGHGSLAVLTRGDATDSKTIEHIAHQVLGSIVWLGAGT